MEERYHATRQNRFYPNIYKVSMHITVEAKLISPPTYIYIYIYIYIYCTAAILNLHGQFHWKMTLSGLPYVHHVVSLCINKSR